MSAWETVIGLEVHVQLKTRTKLFCGCVTKYGSDANTQVCPVCLGLPGVLPVLNRQAFQLAIRAGVSLGCEVAPVTKFDRKNYFYPDLPKGYQISQFDRPLNGKGKLEIELPGGAKKTIGITRVHLEEDAGKSIHPESESAAGYSFVDLNRAGVPLVEIVSEPDMRTPEEAYAYLTTLKAILQYVDVSDCDMEKGSLRCDANVSIRKPGDPFGTKTEIKNLNSFKAVAKALAFEVERHRGILESGGKVQQVTLTWDAVAEKTIVLRSKEEAHDYRYFPEPDLIEIQADPAMVARIREALPEVPSVRRERYMKELGLPAYDAGVLTADKEVAALFDRLRDTGLAPRIAANWISKHVMAAMNDKRIGASEFVKNVPRIAAVAQKVEAKEITGQTGAEIFAWILASPESESVDDYIRKNGLGQISDTGALEATIAEVIAKNPKIVADYKGGKPAALGALIGQVMKASGGKANPAVAKDLLLKALS